MRTVLLEFLIASTCSLVYAKAFPTKIHSTRHLSFSTNMSLRRNKVATRSIRGGSNKSDSSATPNTQLSASSSFDNGPLWRSTGVIVGINALGYLINLVAPHAHYHVDLLGTSAFGIAAATAAASSSLTRVRWSSTAVVTWSIKLASFLFYRVIANGHDARLDDILSNPTSAAGFWIFSMFWGLLGSLPHTFGCTSRLPGNPLVLKAGASLFGIALITETLADYQKWAFKRQNPGEFCSVGLWSLSQHPNYFGNLLYVICLKYAPH